MEMARGVLLDNERKAGGALGSGEGAAGFGGDGEVAHAAVFGELLIDQVSGGGRGRRRLAGFRGGFCGRVGAGGLGWRLGELGHGHSYRSWLQSL